MSSLEKLFLLHQEAQSLAFDYYLRKGLRHRQLEKIAAVTASPKIFIAYAQKYSPNQPRVPAGNPGGGQWTSGINGDLLGIDDPPIIPVYPIETLLSLFSGGSIASIIKNAVMTLVGFASRGTFGSDVEQLAKDLEEYFGGIPDTIRNPAGDFIMMRDGKKIRFDINRTFPHDEPHFHIERSTSSGNWRDAGDQHTYFFRKD